MRRVIQSSTLPVTLKLCGDVLQLSLKVRRELLRQLVGVVDTTLHDHLYWGLNVDALFSIARLSSLGEGEYQWLGRQLQAVYAFRALSANVSPAPITASGAAPLIPLEMLPNAGDQLTSVAVHADH